MIPSDHFVRFYNEVFKAVEAEGHAHIVSYWRELGRMQTETLGEAFRNGGLQAAYDYWSVIMYEEDCKGELTLTDDYFEFRMDCCPSLSKVLDNDASPCHLYCDHCAGWVEPVAQYAGLYLAYDMESRTEPHCRMRLYRDPDKAAAFLKEARLPAAPYNSCCAGTEK